MSGGGDTPTQNTYWAYELESGKYVLGSFRDDVLNIECETDSSDLWVVDEEGIYIENIALHSYLESEIVDAINAKYKTNFNELTVKQVTDVDIGDDCPNWEDYEKIMMSKKEYFRYQHTGSTAFVTGFVQGERAFLNTNSSNATWNVSPEGEVWGAGGPVSTLEAEAKQLLLKKFGKDFNVIEAFVENWVSGQTVPNWDKYEVLSV